MSCVTTILFDDEGSATSLHTDDLDLSEIGPVTRCERASTIEFDIPTQQWEVRTPDNKLLSSNKSRRICLEWEKENIKPIPKNSTIP